MRWQAAASIWSSIAPRGISRPSQWPQFAPIGRRCVQIAATPSSTSPPNDQWNGTSTVVSHPDARFDVLGSPFSLLSVSLSASQPLYTRRGTLTALSGKPESVVSTLSLLSPLIRLAGRIPFLYQRIQATAPITALIASRQQQTTFAVVYLDGRVDWVVAQRDALLAWTGHALAVKPRLNLRAGLGVQYWGNSVVTGRGLVALVGKGQVYQIGLQEGEEYVVHPSAVVAYTANNGKGSGPTPYRFKSRALNLQIPSIAGWLPETRFMREMRKTDTWKFLARAFFSLRRWTRRTIWGDRLFLHFKGPTTILVQSRASRLRDLLSNSEVDEIADVQAGVVQEALARAERKETGRGGSTSSSGSDSGPVPGPLMPDEKPTMISFATVRGGKVDFQGTKPS